MITFISLFDDSVEIDIDVEYDAVYQPARISGPPEDCYPDESDLTVTGYKIVSVTVHSDDHPPVTGEAIEEAFEAARERIEQECWTEYMDRDE